MLTIRDVAKKAKVSVMTVSRVINNPDKVSAKTFQEICQTMERLGYQPSHIAQSLVRKRTYTLGVVMPNIKNTFFNSWFRNLEEHAKSFNYTLLLGDTGEDIKHEMNHVRLLHSHRVDGIIIVPHSYETVSYLIKSKMPFVVADRFIPKVKSDYVLTDHYAGAFEAVEYLVLLGHKKIAVLKGPGLIYPDIERYRGFLDVMRKHNIKDPELYVRNCDFQESLAYEAVKELLGRRDHPTAIFSFNSIMTIGAIKAIQSLKLSIRDNISLIGFDAIPGQSIFRPAITYVLQPIEDLARNAVQILLKKIEHPNSKKKYRLFLKPKLIIGESCGYVK